jgi:hypothetical protein
MEVTASVRWLTPEEGGWSELPVGGVDMFGVAQLTESGVEEAYGADFSVVLSWEGPATSADTTPLRVRTLIDNAFSRPGQRFVFKDGPRPLAVGEVTSL